MSKKTTEAILKKGLHKSTSKGMSLLELEISTRELLNDGKSYNKDLDGFTLEELKEAEATMLERIQNNAR